MESVEKREKRVKWEKKKKEKKKNSGKNEEAADQPRPLWFSGMYVTEEYRRIRLYPYVYCIHCMPFMPHRST